MIYAAAVCVISVTLFVIAVLMSTHPRHGAVPPVPRRAMRQLSERLADLPDDPDGTR